MALVWRISAFSYVHYLIRAQAGKYHLCGTIMVAERWMIFELGKAASSYLLCKRSVCGSMMVGCPSLVVLVHLIIIFLVRYQF